MNNATFSSRTAALHAIAAAAAIEPAPSDPGPPVTLRRRSYGYVDEHHRFAVMPAGEHGWQIHDQRSENTTTARTLDEARAIILVASMSA